ncbi:transcriptional regulator with XRE-family HTH domain [Leifsonia sp. AK011]|uniref:helix-turn-helix domain-containing protein n=1 Tax=Leifsonia sp. AK011 TaxID=2723075 RepID=UPI0015CE534B|nr:helix-turn-helix transcriptional regulator [Leifsonia sp. AK011]NYF09924.1 transcriptional regulator with XRE-family HTH domain [Leifsonia sp. AK011]
MKVAWRWLSPLQRLEIEMPQDAEPIENQIVAGRLKAAREAVGFTQEEVSGALGIPRTSVHAFEAGKRSVSALELRRLSRLYRRNIEWLLGEDVEPVESDSALHRATRELSDEDRQQVVRFAEFLAAGMTRSQSAEKSGE